MSRLERDSVELNSYMYSRFVYVLPDFVITQRSQMVRSQHMPCIEHMHDACTK